MPRLEFTLTGDYVELHNLLKIMGLADSGGSAKMRVAEGEVKVDGKIELRKTCKIRAGQTVLVDDTTIKIRKRYEPGTRCATCVEWQSFTSARLRRQDR